ncbi:MAG: HIT family protein [Candidatus Pacebacteria bacterium]|nr:HIT family protein [Candidatus Paceibacterota bacterium]
MSSEKTIFERIIEGEIPCEKIYENENYFVLVDNRPINLGHALIIPKKPIDYIFDLDKETYLGLFELATKIAPAIQKATNCVRVGMAVEGFGVPHAHLHLIPLFKQFELDPDLAHEETPESLKEIGEKIKSFL